MYKQLVDWWNMKTRAIQSDRFIKQGYKQHLAVTEKEHSAGLCVENNRGYDVAFGGSGASKITSEAAAKVSKIIPETKEAFIKSLREANPKNYKYGDYGKYPKYDSNMNDTFWGKILCSDGLQKTGEALDSKPSVGQAFTSLIIAGILRPATNLAMAGKDDREDSIYAASHAIASSVIGYLVSATVLKPFDDAFKQISKDPEKHLAGCEELLGLQKIGKRRIETSARWAKVSQICKMSFDTFILGVPKAMLTIALIPPILKYGFGMEKKPKKEAAQPENAYAMQQLLNKPVFAQFKGGIK